MRDEVNIASYLQEYWSEFAKGEVFISLFLKDGNSFLAPEWHIEEYGDDCVELRGKGAVLVPFSAISFVKVDYVEDIGNNAG